MIYHMSMIYDRIRDMGVKLPEPPDPAGAYTAVVVVGNLAFVSGQIPFRDGVVQYVGKVGDSNMDEACQAARLCCVNMLAQLGRRPGLDRVQRFVRITGYVNSEEGFGGQPRVIDAASNMLRDIFGDRGIHTRAAVGVSELPLNSMVEIDGIVQV